MKQETGIDKKCTLLVVDDDPTVLAFLTSILGSKFHLITASRGDDALQLSKITKDPIQLLLSDFEMPGMNGIELATQITALRPDIEVLLMSGFKGGMLVLNEGWHFMPKPFIASNLITLINGLIAPPKSKFTAV